MWRTGPQSRTRLAWAMCTFIHAGCGRTAGGWVGNHPAVAVMKNASALGGGCTCERQPHASSSAHAQHSHTAMHAPSLPVQVLQVQHPPQLPHPPLQQQQQQPRPSHQQPWLQQGRPRLRLPCAESARRLAWWTIRCLKVKKVGRLGACANDGGVAAAAFGACVNAEGGQLHMGCQAGRDGGTPAHDSCIVCAAPPPPHLPHLPHTIPHPPPPLQPAPSTSQLPISCRTRQQQGATRTGLPGRQRLMTGPCCWPHPAATRLSGRICRSAPWTGGCWAVGVGARLGPCLPAPRAWGCWLGVGRADGGGWVPCAWDPWPRLNRDLLHPGSHCRWQDAGRSQSLISLGHGSQAHGAHASTPPPALAVWQLWRGSVGSPTVHPQAAALPHDGCQPLPCLRPPAPRRFDNVLQQAEREQERSSRRGGASASSTSSRASWWGQFRCVGAGGTLWGRFCGGGLCVWGGGGAGV